MSKLYDAVKGAEHPLQAYQKALTNHVREAHCCTTVIMELSPICNFTCPFCYARVSPQQMKERGETVRRFADWKPMIDQFAEMGVMGISLTGGECMLHPDFTEIYRYIYKKDINVGLLTNGSALTPAILDLFCECPPSGIFITVYGGSPATYEKVCGKAEYYDRVLNNIKLLLDKKMPVTLQTTVCKDNLEDFKAIYELSRELGVGLNPTSELMEVRRCSADIIKKESINQDKYRELTTAMFEDTTKKLEGEGQQSGKKPVYSMTPYFDPPVKKGMTCSGGVHSCTINYKGQMLPCIAFDSIVVETVNRTMQDCWEELKARCAEIPRLLECQTCIHRFRCSSCMASHYNDTKEFGKVSPRLCFKCLYPEKAREIEERFAKNGYLLSDVDEFSFRP